MKIKERPEYSNKPKVVTFSGDETVSSATAVMSKKNIGCIVVANEDNEVDGILTERDLMIRVLDKKKDPEKTKLRDVMTKDVRVGREDDMVVDWLRIMSNERFRHLPVVNDSGKIVNIMSQGDFVSYTWPDLIKEIRYKTKETVSTSYQIVLIVFAMLAYALLMHVFA